MSSYSAAPEALDLDLQTSHHQVHRRGTRLPPGQLSKIHWRTLRGFLARVSPDPNPVRHSKFLTAGQALTPRKITCHRTAAEGLAAAGEMIARYRGGSRFTSDYEVARLTVALRDLRVRDDAWARMDPAHTDAHLRLWTDVTRRAQPGHVAAPATLLALARCC